MIYISAVICTRNNANLLLSALESLRQQTLAPDEFEIIVVDNASTDATGEIITKYATETTGPAVKSVLEPRVGLSHARNTGYLNASGHWVAYMDDDARAEPGWLEAFVHAAEQDLGAVAIAGKVKPAWVAAPPDWWNSHFDRSVSVVDWGDETRHIKMPEWMCGANYAVQREVLRALGGHDPRFGRQPGVRLGGEETELQIRIEKMGLPILYAPAAAVMHLIPRHRLTKRYYLQQQVWSGRTQYLMDLKHAPALRKQVILRSLIRSPRSLILAAGNKLGSDTQAEWGRLGQVYWTLGYLWQAITSPRIWPE